MVGCDREAGLKQFSKMQRWKEEAQCAPSWVFSRGVGPQWRPVHPVISVLFPKCILMSLQWHRISRSQNPGITITCAELRKGLHRSVRRSRRRALALLSSQSRHLTSPALLQGHVVSRCVFSCYYSYSLGCDSLKWLSVLLDEGTWASWLARSSW